jgi:hypothetical protein
VDATLIIQSKFLRSLNAKTGFLDFKDTVPLNKNLKYQRLNSKERASD